MSLIAFSTYLPMIAELVATVTGILCVYLQTQEKRIAWIFGIISVSILAGLFFRGNLLSDFVLHIIFLVLNIYGWFTWRQYDQTNLSVLTFARKGWLWTIGIIIIVTPIWGYMMQRFFNPDLVFFDAFTTVGSLVAQYLLAKKYLENWLVWIVVDVVAVSMYTYKGLYFVAFLFIVYLFLCTKGYIDWKKRDRNDNSHPSKHLVNL